MKNNNKCIILANGKPPRKSIIQFLQKKGYTKLICADGGANTARKMNLLPDYIIGDLDSISSANLAHYHEITKIIKIKRQNDTDTEKCIKTAIRKGIYDIILTGVTGDRLDHTFCNLGIVIKFSKLVHLKIMAENSLLASYSGNVSFETYPGETISLYGFDRRTKIISHGLYYRLNNISLPFGEQESTSNIAIGARVELKITGGIIFVIRDFKTMMKHDLF
jgi:thiamine pyrophosphokinase